MYLGVAFVVAACIASPLAAQELDKGYVSAFGWGTAAVAQERAPAMGQYEPALFRFQNGKFLMTAGENQDLHCRFLLKGGKPYGFHLSAVKKSSGKKTATLKDEYIRTRFYVSNDELGSQLYTAWPSGPNDLPAWSPIATNEINYAPAAGWVSSRFSMMEEPSDMASLISWMKKARPGWKIYIVHTAGYRREAPEAKYWDKSLLKWMIPLEYVDTEPLAVATVEVEKSTNPMLAWSYTIDKMPSDQKGGKDGIMTVLKDGAKATTFKFGIEYKYQNTVTKRHNLTVHYEYEDGIVCGGFYANEVPSIEAGIQNTFYEAIGRAMSEEKLK
jgi:hypothetical protein